MKDYCGKKHLYRLQPISPSLPDCLTSKLQQYRLLLSNHFVKQVLQLKIRNEKLNVNFYNFSVFREDPNRPESFGAAVVSIFEEALK